MRLTAHQQAGRAAARPPTSSSRHSRLRTSSQLAPRAAAATLQETKQQQQAPPTLAELPKELRDVVAVLRAPNAAAPNGSTAVYVLGMSHVSRASADATAALVRAVRPEVVMLELCRDRLGLLVGADEDDARVPDTWHCPRFGFLGLPLSQEGGGDDAVWPSVDELRTLLACGHPGRPVEGAAVEGDVVTLMATGLFARGAPRAEGALSGDAPEFLAARRAGAVVMQMVPPLGCVTFGVEPRSLPAPDAVDVRLDSSVAAVAAAAGVGQAELDAVAAALVAEAAAATSAAAEAAEAAEADKEDEGKRKAAVLARGGVVTAYLAARRCLLALLPDVDCVVAFDGVVGVGSDGGDGAAATTATPTRVEATLRARRASDAPYVSGLESSAVGGEGAGIEPYRPAPRPGTSLSPRMALPAELAAQLKAAVAARDPNALAPLPASALPPNWAPATRFADWGTPGAPPKPTAPEPPLPPAPVADAFGALMTGGYARLQASAGLKVGVEAGEAWRVALRAATEVGTQQVLLGDRPSAISQRRLAQALLLECGGRIAFGLAALGAAPAVALGAAALLPHELRDALAGAAGSASAGDAAAGAAVFAAGLALLAPVLGPFTEVWRLGRMTGPEVEAAVRPPAPLGADPAAPLRLWGEDALLEWPGANEALLDERDAYMAAVLAAAACGGTAPAPAFVADAVDSAQASAQRAWRYMVPRGGDGGNAVPAGAAPPGGGDGVYEPLPAPRAIVAVVGAAHVRGMVRRWDDALLRGRHELGRRRALAAGLRVEEVDEY